VKRRLLAVAALLVLVGSGAAIAYYLYVEHASRDIQGSPTVEFVPTQTVPPAVTREPDVPWPMYGHDAERLRVAAGVTLAPPFRRIWTFHAQSLVEFPPAVAYGRLYFGTNSGRVIAIGAANGRKAWSNDSHRCEAASPAVDRHLVFQVFLNAPPCNRPNSSSLTGELVAFAAGSGSVVWRRTIGPSETSPAVVRGVVYVGAWDGRVSAFAAGSGKLWWSTQLRGEVKGGVAVVGSRVYAADYSSHVYALSARTGKIIWESSAQPRFGSTGTFYATPAVAYDRVYVGATDGKMYSFGAATGELRWSTSTGGYVYSSAAVWDERVFAGSYSHQFFCFDAASGRVLWRFHADGPISGSPSIVAGRVYFATLAGTTYALDARTGRQVWTYPDGKYSPVVADKTRLYLTGYARIYGLVARRAVPSRP
jgi:outer membrane protein assembly factor BamB